MTPQRFDPATQGELGSSSMTRQEGTAIFKGNAERRATWDRRQAIVSHPAFHMGQGDPLHDPVWGEQHRGNMRPIEHGRDIPHRLAAGIQDLVQDFAAGAKAAITGTVLLAGQAERDRLEAGKVLTENAVSAIPRGLNDGLAPLVFQKGFIEYGSPRPDKIPIMTDKTPHEVVAQWVATNNVRLAAPDVEAFPGMIKLLKDGVDEYAPAAANAGRHSRDFNDEAVGLTGTITGVNEVIAATPGHIADVNASFAVASRERLPEMIGQMGTLEDQTLATVDALGRLTAAPRRPTRSGGPSGGGMGASPQGTTATPFEVTPPPPNLQAIYLDQFKQGHDMSGFRDADHWWEAHLAHVAQLKAAGHAFAQGTAFAPGGMALVGEMGPELVNLPRGSQVIPNPRLGSEVTVNVNVEGSVVAERDLAQRIRQELIRTSRRTVDLGFVT